MSSGTEDCAPAPERASGSTLANRVDTHQLALRRAFEAGREEWGELPVEFERFAHTVLARIDRRLVRAGIAPDDETRVHEALSASCAADLYLAIALEAGDGDAWMALERKLHPRLGALARKRGADRSEAREILDELAGELVSPTAGEGHPTRLSTYDGTGSLFGWLAVFVSRRVADRARARRHDSLDAPEEPNGPPTDTGRAVTGEADDPGEVAAADEAASVVREAVESAWSRLGDREQLALLFKFRDELPQKEIARMFGVGAPRVTRILQGALEKLRTGVAEVVGDLDPAHLAEVPAFWASLAGNMANSLQSVRSETDPPVSGGT